MCVGLVVKDGPTPGPACWLDRMEEEEVHGTVQYLQPQLVEAIVRRLGLPDLLRCRLVCRHWNQVSAEWGSHASHLGLDLPGTSGALTRFLFVEDASLHACMPGTTSWQPPKTQNRVCVRGCAGGCGPHYDGGEVGVKADHLGIAIV